MEASLTFERDKMRMLRIILWLMGIIDKAAQSPERPKRSQSRNPG